MKAQRGFTLVELMVAVTLVGVITALSVKLASTVLDAYREQRLALAIERAARASIDLIADAVRNASAGVPTGDARDAAGCSSVVGVEVANDDNGPDRLDLIYATGGVVTSLRTLFTADSTTFGITDSTGLAAGDHLLITDGDAGRLVPVAAITPSGVGFLVDTVAPAANCPGVVMPVDGFAVGALVVRARAASFFIEVDADGQPTLMMDPDLDGPHDAEPLADGIEDLQIAVGVDVDGDGVLRDDGTTGDEWFYNAAGDPDPPAVTVTRWRALRLTVVARTPHERSTALVSQRPAVEDRRAGVSDPYRRRVLSTVVEIRNLEGSP